MLVIVFFISSYYWKALMIYNAGGKVSTSNCLPMRLILMLRNVQSMLLLRHTEGSGREHFEHENQSQRY